MNYFKAARTAFLLVARRAVSRAGAERRVLEGFRDGAEYVPSEGDWREAVDNVTATILDVDDNSFINSQNRSSRNKKIESLRLGLRWLAKSRLIPVDIEPQGRLEDRDHAPGKCLATLSFEAGRLDVSHLTAEQAANAFIQRNREMLEEIRRCLWLELEQNWKVFQMGRELMELDGLPSIDEMDLAMESLSRAECANGIPFHHFGLSSHQRLGIVLRLLKHRAAGGVFRCGGEKITRLCSPIIEHYDAQQYLEATAEALNAAFHLVMIDADGGNVQPIEDIPLDLYVGRPRRGKQQIRTVKNRAGASKAKRSEPMLRLTTKGSLGRPSGVEIVEVYKALTAPMRSTIGPTAARLWLWRTAGTIKVSTSMATGHYRWQEFLVRHSDNPIIGGLPITRQVLRRAVGNALWSVGEFDYRILQAVFGHANTSTFFGYLSEGAVRALLNSKIRDFINALEAVTMLGIDDAAALLGLSAAELNRRTELGLESGLAFAAVGSKRDATISNTEECPPLLDNRAALLAVSARSLRALELARRALREQFAKMANVNPERFVRRWLTYMAIVEGYCEMISKSRFRVKFKKICVQIEDDLSSGSVSLPVLW